uniref:Glycine rich superfamily member n=1 Tax=Globodera pallida TaxID=36090 RepID=A0A183C981_GLOPA
MQERETQGPNREDRKGGVGKNLEKREEMTTEEGQGQTWEVETVNSKGRGLKLAITGHLVLLIIGCLIGKGCGMDQKDMGRPRMHAEIVQDEVDPELQQWPLEKLMQGASMGEGHPNSYQRVENVLLGIDTVQNHSIQQLHETSEGQQGPSLPAEGGPSTSSTTPVRSPHPYWENRRGGPSERRGGGRGGGATYHGGRPGYSGHMGSGR